MRRQQAIHYKVVVHSSTFSTVSTANTEWSDILMLLQGGDTKLDGFESFCSELQLYQ